MTNDHDPIVAARVALVTGSTGGIGRAIALALARDGMDIVAVSRDEGALDRLADEVRSVGRLCLPLTFDLLQVASVPEIVDRAWSWRGQVDVLVNAAGVLVRKPDSEVSVEEFDRTFTVNVRAPFYLIETLGPLMVQSGRGSMVNVTSAAGTVVTKAPGPYQASKAALIHLTRYFAVRFAPSVRVNAVGPAYVRTPMTEAWLSDAANERYVLERTPLGRVGEPTDVAEAVTFLASDRASYVTGHHLVLDGGWTLS